MVWLTPSQFHTVRPRKKVLYRSPILGREKVFKDLDRVLKDLVGWLRTSKHDLESEKHVIRAVHWKVITASS